MGDVLKFSDPAKPAYGSLKSWENIDSASVIVLRNRAADVGHVSPQFDGDVSDEDREIDELAEVLIAAGVERLRAVKLANVIVVYQSRRAAVAMTLKGAPGGMSKVGCDSVIGMDTQEGLRLMLCTLLGSPRPRWSVGCLMLALGITDEVKTERKWSERQLLSIEHTSNEVRRWQRLLRLPPTEAQKSDAARGAYSLSNGAVAKAA